MKKIWSKMLIILSCFMLSVITAYALTEWTSGENFFEKGTTYNREANRGKTFEQGLIMVGFYEGNSVTVNLSARTKVLGVYINKVGEKDCPVTSTTISCGVGYTMAVSDNNDVQFRWKQTTNGRMAAQLYYPS